MAARLGITERYLHKLMQAHSGLSPVQWQKYHQLLFAKQLLQQSALSVGDVAIACGFGSARRLQQMMKNTWSLTPSQLRSRRHDCDTDQGIRVQLHYRKPYNWDFVRAFLKARAIPGVETVGEQYYERVFSDEVASGRLIAVHQEDKSAFDVTLFTAYLPGVRPVLANLARVLDLHADPELITTALIQAGIPEKDVLPGLRLPGVWSPFEAGCRAVLGQQVSVKSAIANVRKLTDRLGETTEYGKAFPGPGKVAKDELTFLKMPASRKLALRNLSACFAESARSGVSLPLTEELEEKLLALKGIGPWTVDYLILRGLSHPDRFLAGDLVVRNMQAGLHLQPEQAAPWRSYLTLQLWQMASKLNNGT